ncbi:DUF2911 domain-containing protein [Cytophagaceae bacterium DM2B3-1]|uniref:DUF2911 domain-containing protein n=2 Tax=Xanthocytophaga TaxID=3078918 RepID=A0AAE3U8J6_9BACT|nr:MULTISPECIES: DUF2911 domain-containing protein [Xanthocytophaga]MDJ1469600.1 DUF2911 domain-containing protein [Xanthocytophaga flavus]MDJ1480754.1 DUF2911 domain-containing protein [Xanthocytophaga flavus]MDJ1493546.1 DUF2911 domain-containing protein [Xanthocytophaga flavus]MDJ1506191.1 DUF2911 domain-containing protein [Xanthocytophaga agilis]
MKKSILLTFAFALASILAFGQNPPKSPRITSESKFIKVSYGQPSKRGRTIFGPNGIEPFGKVWRTGANQATEITFTKDGKFGGTPVKAGTYTLFTIPEEKEWTVLLNSQLGQFGAFEYDKYKDKNVLEVKVPVKKLSSPVEKFTITPSDKDLKIEWDQTSVVVPVSF